MDTWTRSGFMISSWQVAKANIIVFNGHDRGINGQPSRLKNTIVHTLVCCRTDGAERASAALNVTPKGLLGFWINNGRINAVVCRTAIVCNILTCLHTFVQLSAHYRFWAAIYSLRTVSFPLLFPFFFLFTSTTIWILLLLLLLLL